MLPKLSTLIKDNMTAMREYNIEEITWIWRKAYEEKEKIPYTPLKESTFLFNHNGERVYPTIVGRIGCKNF